MAPTHYPRGMVMSDAARVALLKRIVGLLLGPFGAAHSTGLALERLRLQHGAGWLEAYAREVGHE